MGFWTEWQTVLLRKREDILSSDEVMEILKLLGPAQEAVAHKLKLIEASREKLTKLRGLIGETCQDCHHAKYCQHKANYDFNQDWILGCQYWTPDTRTNKDDVTRWVGKVL